MYCKEIDFNSLESLWKYCKSHSTYYVFGPQQQTRSFSNNVKLYNLDLDGDWILAYNIISSDNGEYEITELLADWELQHDGYTIEQNGCSGGYYVLVKSSNKKLVTLLTDELTSILEYSSFEEYSKNRQEDNDVEILKETALVLNDFDKLCDDIRDYVNKLSLTDMKSICDENLVSLAEEFNLRYEPELTALKLPVEVKDNKIDISNLTKYRSLLEAFVKTAREYELPGISISYIEYTDVHYIVKR